MGPLLFSGSHGAPNDRFEAVGSGEFAEDELAAGFAGEGPRQVVAADETFGLRFGVGVKFGAELALCLEPGEVLAGESEIVAGVGTGAVDLNLSGGGGFVLLHGIEAGFEGGGEEVGFDEGATAETPGGVEDFHGVGALHGGGGTEVGLEGGAEFVVLGLFFGTDQVAGGEEAEGDGVLGDGGLAVGGFGARGVLGVGLVGGLTGVGCQHDWGPPLSGVLVLGSGLVQMEARFECWSLSRPTRSRSMNSLFVILEVVCNRGWQNEG